MIGCATHLSSQMTCSCCSVLTPWPPSFSLVFAGSLAATTPAPEALLCVIGGPADEYDEFPVGSYRTPNLHSDGHGY
jgi:hypothetical protein